MPRSCTPPPRRSTRAGLAPGFPALIRETWRDRGFGDFWGYALVAEGAAEAMIEVGPHSWDLAAPAVIVEEAGGRFTDLRGERTIHSGHALATNGLVHDAIQARLGTEAACSGDQRVAVPVAWWTTITEALRVQQDVARHAAQDHRLQAGPGVGPDDHEVDALTGGLRRSSRRGRPRAIARSRPGRRP